MIMLISTLTLFLPLYGAAAANAEGTTFGQVQSARRPFTESTKTTNDVLSTPHKETPATSVDNDTQAMLDGRTQNKSDKLDGDVLVDRAISVGDQIAVNPNTEINLTEARSSSADQIVTCVESKTSPTQFFHRTLHLDIYHQPEIKKKRCIRRIQYCTGSDHHRDDDPDCPSHAHRDGEERTINTWESCGQFGWRDYRDYVVTEQYERTELRGEHWSVEDPNNLVPKIKSNQCNIVQTIPLEGPSSKTYYGQSFHRPCWREKVIVALPEEKTNTCAHWRRQGCVEIDAHCTQTAPDGSCETWTKRYRCPTHVAQRFRSTQDGIHCIDGGNLVKQSTKYDDMASSLAQLQVLSEIRSNITDWTNPSVFKGQCHKCKKNVLGNMLYDCCFAKAGFAISLGLTNCNAEERQLGQLRAEGKCHYVGSIPNQLLDILWKSSDTHVYCCFPSKLISILQREARKQLGKTFGTAEGPDCGGFTMEEIGRMDFSQLDLSELFDEIMESAKKGTQTANTENLEARMKDKLTSFHYRPKEVTA